MHRPEAGRGADVVVGHVASHVGEVDAEAHLCRLVAHRVDTMKRSPPRVHVDNVLDEVSGRRVEVGRPGRVDVGGQRVENDDLVAAVDQFIDDV